MTRCCNLSSSAAAIVLSQSESTVESKVRRIQRVFCRSTALGGVDICDQLPRSARPSSANKRKKVTNKPPPIVIEDIVQDEYSSAKWKESDPLAVQKERELNVSRIVFGNIDMFIDKYPFFVHRLNVWIEVTVLLLQLTHSTFTNLFVYNNREGIRPRDGSHDFVRQTRPTEPQPGHSPTASEAAVRRRGDGAVLAHGSRRCSQ
mmetsp:Transcript_32747/g.47282  ORF Transcript_32747/g.47282 Transcript_32747/m.47282 type:complete len:204 (+) Transcript_32747:1090-1701(+)